MTRRDAVQSALRAFHVVEALNRQRVTSLDTLHALTQLPKSTLVRLMETLIEGGYAFRVSRREGYALTERVLRLSAGVRTRDILVDVARPILEAFTRQHKWQISLSTSESGSMLVRFSTRQISPFAREEIFLNRRISILHSAVGQAYFAACSEVERELILKLLKAADPEQIDTIGGPARLAALMGQVRRDGYASRVLPETEPTCGLAAPILTPDVDDRPLGALVMTYYRAAMTEREAIAKYLDVLKDVARRIALGLVRATDAGGDAEVSAASGSAVETIRRLPSRPADA
jgi:IclR family mhp operon transcriptional activator